MKRLLKLEQPGCRPCVMVSTFLDNLGVSYEKVDVTKYPEIASRFEVMSVPVTILLDYEGNEIKRSTGFKPNELEEMIQLLNN